MFRKFLMMLFLIPTLAWANWDPVKNPIEIIVPYPPGGNSDRVARKISEMFQDRGWKSVVVNRPGADTVIGANFVAKAKPDGYTLYMGGNGFLDSNIAFKTRPPGIEYTKDSFVPVVPMGYTPLALVAPPNAPFTTYDEFKNYIRKNPNQFNLGFWNSYTANLFLEWARVENLPPPNIIPYKGSAPQMTDVAGGQITAAWDTQTTSKIFSESGKVKYIANLSELGKRFPSIDLVIWYGLYAPAGTDPTIIKEINQVVNTAVRRPDIQSTFQSFEIYDIGGSPEKLQRMQQKAFDVLHNISKRFDK